MSALSAAVILSTALLVGCAGSTANLPEKSSQQWYEEGTKLAAKEKYDEALTSYREAAKGYRGADLDADIQLALADTFFLKEEYPAAVEAYTEFLRLHPHNTRADYAQLRVGLGWTNQLRSADRSQEAARKGVAAFEALLRGYPHSSLLDQARAGLETCRRRIVEHELEIADFYLRTGSYRAAAGRYEQVLKQFADSRYTERVLYALVRCYRQLRDEEKASRLIEQLRREYPEGRFVKELSNLRS